MSADGEVKSIYLTNRNPLLPRERFPERWRRHGELAMSLPFWQYSTGYFHCDVSASPPSEHDPQLPAAWSGDFAGVGVVYVRSARELEALTSHPAHARLRMDEFALFERPISEVALITQETVLRERPGTAVKIFAFLPPAENITPEEFSERWTQHAASLMRHEDLARPLTKYTHNHVLAAEEVDSSAVRERARRGFRGFTGIAEIGFASRDDLIAFLRHPARKDAGDDLATFCAVDQIALVETNEVTMYPRQ